MKCKMIIFFVLVIVFCNISCFLNSIATNDRNVTDIYTNEKDSILNLSELNILSQKKNGRTHYLIQKEYDLNNSMVIVPNGSLLHFKGGCLKNGIIVGDSTEIKSNKKIIFKNILIEGTWDVDSIYSSWFDFVCNDSYVDNSRNFNNVVKLSSDNMNNSIFIDEGIYYAQIDNGIPIVNISPNGKALLELRSNTVLYNNGTICLMKSKNSRYAICYAYKKKNIYIKGGVYIGDVNSHSSFGGVKGQNEQGHGFFFRNSSNCCIDDVYVSKCWGDGVVIGIYDEKDFYPEDIKIKNSTFDDNRRQGCSITGAKSIFIDNCKFINTGRTKFTPPGAGIDLEPNSIYSGNENIYITNCYFEHNKGFAIQLHSANKSVNIENCINRKGNGGLGVNVFSENNDCILNAKGCCFGEGITLFGGKVNLVDCSWGGTVFGSSTFGIPISCKIDGCHIGKPFDTMNYFKRILYFAKNYSEANVSIKNSIIKRGDVINSFISFFPNYNSNIISVTIDNCKIDWANSTLVISNPMQIKSSEISRIEQLMFEFKKTQREGVSFSNNDVFFSRGKSTNIFINSMQEEALSEPLLNIKDCRFYSYSVPDENFISTIPSKYNKYIINNVYIDKSTLDIRNKIERKVRNRIPCEITFNNEVISGIFENE